MRPPPLCQPDGYLARFGYTVLSMDQVLECLRGRAAVPDKAVALTFDDGYENFYEYAFPVLQSMAFRPWSHDLRPARPALALVRRRQPRHPADHEAPGGSVSCAARASTSARTGRPPQLAQQSTEIIRDDVRRSSSRSRTMLGEQVRHFCYPMAVDRRAIDAVADAGYASATTCVRGPASSADDPLTLPRKAISWGDNLLGYFWRLHEEHPQDRADPPWRRDPADALTRA